MRSSDIPLKTSIAKSRNSWLKQPKKSKQAWATSTLPTHLKFRNHGFETIAHNPPNYLFTMSHPIGLACDHAGFELMTFVKEYLTRKKLEYKDYGTYSTNSCDYPDYAHALANGIESNEVKQGIAICGSGEGISMTLNKHQGVRAALVWMPEIAHMTRLHNDANVLVMPGRYISTETAEAILDEFFSTQFEGGRHIRRVEKIPVTK